MPSGPIPFRIARLDLAVELLGDITDPRGFAVHPGAEAPAGEVAAVEQAPETGLRLPVLGMDHGRQGDRQERDECKGASAWTSSSGSGSGPSDRDQSTEWPLQGGETPMISLRSRRNKGIALW